MAQTVIGFFDDASEANTAVERLQSKGISRDRIDISRGSASAGSTGSSTVSGERTVSEGRTVDDEGRNTNAITDFFNSLFGGKKDDADRYSRVAENSNTIVTVHAATEDEAEAAADILDDCGAIDVDERASQYGFTTASSPRQDMGQRTNVSGEEDTTVERIEENLEVGKKQVESGGVRVRSRIVERPVEEHIRLREEHVHVERNPVDRPVSQRDLSNFKEGDIELTERAEVPVVNKEARVVEEIRVSKDVDEREETIRDSVRHTEVDVDDNTTGTTRRNSTDLDNEEDTDSTAGNRSL